MTNLQQVANVCRAIWPGARPTPHREEDTIVISLDHRRLVHRLVILHEPAPKGIRLVQALFSAGIPARIEAATEPELVIVDMGREEGDGFVLPAASESLH